MKFVKIKIWFDPHVRINGMYLGPRWRMSNAWGMFIFMTHPYLGTKRLTDEYVVVDETKHDH